MDIIEHIKSSKKKTFSVELLPPRNGESVAQVYKVLEDLSDLKLDFVSITHGSGGSLRGGTDALGALIRERYGLEPLIHLTCLDQSREMMENELMILKYLGLNNVLALRGDPPWGIKEFTPHSHGHRNALGLVHQVSELNQGHYLLRKTDYKMYKLPEDAKYREGEKSEFVVCCACYPEGHSEGSTIAQEVDYALRKIEAGAQMLITQMLFSAEVYSSFVEKILYRFPETVIIPGVMPLVKKSQVGFVEKMFGVKVPKKYAENILSADTPNEKGVELSAQLCRDLFEAGAPGVHFFTMNESHNVRQIIKELEHGFIKVFS
jgi:methylenetetrahydrofolate reductase (NADPH)